ncbi:hypothetical protein MLD38_019418 [Melastoma candidum]|uniref:Uncharacterized protein n=1 Tax=Melastoma candidum TaxID=119954 RepID=A0ACB9R588_9MYRT|nr:hypothetical protein MLD38_019418 [Melastoma candidum]
MSFSRLKPRTFPRAETQRSPPPNISIHLLEPVAIPTALKQCAIFNHGILIHQSAIVRGLASDPFVASSLISFYSRFGDVSTAHQLFDLMPVKTLVPYTSLMSGYSDSGQHDTAFSLFNDMRNHGIGPSEVTFLGLLGKESLGVCRLRSLHCGIALYGFGRDVVVGNALISGYGKCSCVKDAKELFNEMEEKDVVSWNSMVSVYAGAGDVDRIMGVMCIMRREGVAFDGRILGYLVNAAAMDGDVKLAKVVHGHVLRQLVQLDKQIATCILRMYMKCGNLDAAVRVFELAEDKDVVQWTVLLSGLVQNDCGDWAIMVFRMMIESGEIPSCITISCVLAACAQLGNINLGRSLHGHILRNKVGFDVAMHNSLLTMYAKCERIEQCRSVFVSMHKKDVVTWNAIIDGYAQTGDLSEAFSLFNMMQESHQKPDAITILALLQACASLGALHQGKWIHTFVLRNWLGESILVNTALVDMYSKCGSMDNAERCFRKMPNQDIVSWGTIIDGYGRHGKGDIALRMYSEFLQRGFRPNDVIFLSVLSACSHDGLVQEGLELYESMTKEYAIRPRIEHYACVVDLLCRAGRIDEACSFYKKVFLEPSFTVLSIILDACRANGNRRLHDEITRKLSLHVYDDAGLYVQLAHSNASMNRWDTVGESWAQMRSLGLKKLPGWSFIELFGCITTFFTDHSSHPQMEDIVSLLKTLNRDMKRKNGNEQDVISCHLTW